MSGSNDTILVVDDEADARLVMRAALRKAGYEVRLAGGGDEALQAFAAQPCALVMLDVDMPGMDGFEVCRRLRALAGPQLPIVMVTGMDDVASVENAYRSGATDFVAKPVNWALIGHRVRYLLRGQEVLRDLGAAQARNEAILGAIPDLLFEVDADGRYLDYRAAQANLLAAPPAAFLGRTMDEVLPPGPAAVCRAAIREALEQGHSSGRQIELQVPRGTAWFELSIARRVVPEGETPKFIVLSRDISERKLAEDRVMRLAYFDSLTGLPNRRSFLDRVNREILRAARDAHMLAVLFVDLDGFKQVNDTLGHAAGDQLLQNVAHRLQAGLRPSDLLSRPAPLGADRTDAGDADLARLGGDEFTALLPDIDSPDDALAAARRIGEVVRRPYSLEGQEVTLTASVGIALYPFDGSDAATLLRHADTAMYHAKHSGRDNAQVYDRALTEQIRHRLDLHNSLRRAVEHDEFRLEYQPQFDVVAHRVTAVEALLRWTHPSRGPVSPAEFVPVLEDSGAMERLGAWILRTACAQAARWRREHGLEIRVAVNVSPRQFAAPTLVDSVAEALAATGLPAPLLELEITERALMAHTTEIQGTLSALRAMGVRIALDDFGTGYSSLSYVTRMPINHLKIDRTFVAGLFDAAENEAVIRAVLAMARSLGLDVTAEGVETAEQSALLARAECVRQQGFLFSRPVDAAAIPALLERLAGAGQLAVPDAT